MLADHGTRRAVIGGIKASESRAEAGTGEGERMGSRSSRSQLQRKAGRPVQAETRPGVEKQGGLKPHVGAPGRHGSSVAAARPDGQAAAAHSWLRHYHGSVCSVVHCCPGEQRGTGAAAPQDGLGLSPWAGFCVQAAAAVRAASWQQAWVGAAAAGAAAAGAAVEAT